MLQHIFVIITRHLHNVYWFFPVLVVIVLLWAMDSVEGGRKQKQKPVPDVPENILALNTITKLLSYIPRNEPLVPRDNLNNKNWQTPAIRQELKLLDALSKLLVSFREVGAMASSRTVDLNLLGSISDGQEDIVHDTDKGKGLVGRIADKFAGIPDSLKTYLLVGDMNPSEKCVELDRVRLSEKELIKTH